MVIRLGSQRNVCVIFAAKNYETEETLFSDAYENYIGEMCEESLFFWWKIINEFCGDRLDINFLEVVNYSFE